MSSRSFVRILAGVVTIVCVFAGVAPAAASRTHAPATNRLAKPARVAHEDRAPSVPGNIVSSPVPFAAVASLDAMGGSGGGSNSITFSNFDDGDVVVVTDPTSLTGHAGLFDDRYYSSIYSYAVLSANVAPGNGVQREQCLKYRTYDRAYALWVPKKASYGTAARTYAYKQMGKPYSITAAKTDTRSFYCSKLVWAAWRYTSGLDLDGDGGFWVWPIDLVNSRYTTLFGSWS
jgi:cell wall-associated NlpC family hydrolase